MAKKSKVETALQVLKHDAFGNIRWLLIDDVPYFVGKDVAAVLGYTNPRKAIRDHVDEEDLREERIDTPSGTQATKLINESGVYSLILSSKLPAAKKFKRWVTNEVLPSIRKTGTYTLDKDLKELIEARLDGKRMRRIETDNIQHFIEYARSQGCTWEDCKFYSRISVICNLGVGLPHKNGRNFATKEQLRMLALLEGSTVPAVLIDNMANGVHWTQILARVQHQINLCIDAVFPKPLLTSTEVALIR